MGINDHPKAPPRPEKMIVQEPVQAAIWHCLNHYDYKDAVFLSERLYAEVKTDESLFLLATAYYRNGQIDHAYHTLRNKAGSTSQCRYLLGKCAFQLEKYAEAEAVLTDNAFPRTNSIDELVAEYEDQAAFVLLLLSKIFRKTGRNQQAVDSYKKALKLNPFLWSAFETMCRMGEKPNPNVYFQLNDLENLNYCHGTNVCNVENVVVNNTSVQENNTTYVTPDQILKTHWSGNGGLQTQKVCTPDDNAVTVPTPMSGIAFLNSPKVKTTRLKFSESENSNSPAFGNMIDSFDDFVNIESPATLTEANEQKSFTKKVRAHVGNLINRKDSAAILQNSKPVFSQTSNVKNVSPNTPVTVTSGTNVRRSTRLFSNSNSVKENNKSPTRSKFVSPKSPSRKTKQRLAKCSLNDFNNYLDLNTRNRVKKEKSETVTSTNSAIAPAVVANTATVTQVQKASAGGLMRLLREFGQAYMHLSQYNLKGAIDLFNMLPPHQMQTSWVYTMIALAYFELNDYENCISYFGEVRSKEPFRIKFLDVYSSALWHLQKEVTLSALAQELGQLNKNSPVTWIVHGNCFSLQKEHDTAIKFIQRAVQVDPNFPYAYTILGHEYITTEELDKAMSCYRNAIRLDPQHYYAWYGIGTIYSKQERFRLAEMNYNRAFSINPNNSVILTHLGVVQHQLNKTEKALTTLNLAVTKFPKNPLCKFHRASVYFALGRHSEALKELEELKQIVPKESLVYYLTGKIHRTLGNNDLALMNFSWAMDLDPKGASSQIREAFDPSMGRNTEAESTAGSPEAFPSDGNSAYGGLQDDSDDSL